MTISYKRWGTEEKYAIPCRIAGVSTGVPTKIRTQLYDIFGPAGNREAW
jgi:hypothetical protein